MEFMDRNLIKEACFVTQLMICCFIECSYIKKANSVIQLVVLEIVDNFVYLASICASSVAPGAANIGLALYSVSGFE